MDQTRTVMVVDDDQSIVDLMRDFLEADGFSVVGAVDARHALTLMSGTAIDCVLLDIMLPGATGFELCQQIRRRSDVPILFLSGRGADTDKIRGLGLGGDDYIVKSATPPEVVARVKAVLRRYSKGEAKQSVVLNFGRLLLDVQAHEVRVDSLPVSVTPKEYELLYMLAEHPRQLFTYEQLLARFWDDAGDRHTVTVHIGRLREKIEADPSNPCLIVNVWGVGYRFEGIQR